MGNALKMALIASVSLVTLLCQGCSSFVGDYDYRDYVEPASPDLSEGQRLATATDFGSGTSLLLSGRDSLSPINPALAGVIAAQDAGTTLVDPVGAASDFDIVADRTLAEIALTNLAWSRSDGVRAFEGDRERDAYFRPITADQNFSAELTFAAPDTETGLGFDLSLAPRVAYNREGQYETRRIGAELRLGQTLEERFDQRGTRVKVDSWYIFAGQDGEALVWEAGDHGFRNINAMALRDQVTVGDIQAGISVQRGLGELSFSYIHREVEWRDRNGGASDREDFAGISFTMRR